MVPSENRRTRCSISALSAVKGQKGGKRVFAVKSPRKMTYGCIKDKHKGRGEREILPGVAVGCQGWAVVLLASRAYGAHKRNLHLRATPALSLHPEKSEK